MKPQWADNLKRLLFGFAILVSVLAVFSHTVLADETLLGVAVVTCKIAQGGDALYEGHDVTGETLFQITDIGGSCQFQEFSGTLDVGIPLPPTDDQIVIEVSQAGIADVAKNAFAELTFIHLYHAEDLMVFKPVESAEEDKPVDEENQLRAAQEFTEYLSWLEETYPAPTPKEEAAIFEKHGETVATLYCHAAGLPVPCTPLGYQEDSDDEHLGGDTPWYYWLLGSTDVGIIPATDGSSACPPGSNLVEIYHDDEDTNNANSHWGWLGGISQDSNTRFRFCRVPGANFRLFVYAGTVQAYATLRLGWQGCPVGARTVWRYFDNEDNNNNNTQNGNVFPNVNLVKNWLMAFCVFDQSGPAMNQFPNIGVPYGVLAPADGQPWKIQQGHLYKDDEDWWNWNWWLDGGTLSYNGLDVQNIMGGDNNTWMDVARVR